jgi:cytoskeleton protein RodZ
MTSQKELIPMRPGDVLRYEREQQGLSIELAAAQSRIKTSVIEAIESGETGKIPSVYLRGYIRNYARFLGVDTTSLEDEIEHAKGAEPEVRTVFTVNARRNAGEKWLKASSYLVASALIATLAWQFTHEAVRFTQGDSKLNSATADSVDDGDSSRQDVRPANTHINASIASMENLSKRSGLASDSAAAQAWAAISGDTKTESPGVSGFHSLSITTSADTWVEIADASGNQLELDLIRAGSSREYSGMAPFDVMIGRASAVELDMDGAAVDLGPHTRGNVARITLNSQ